MPFQEWCRNCLNNMSIITYDELYSILLYTSIIINTYLQLNRSLIFISSFSVVFKLILMQIKENRFVNYTAADLDHCQLMIIIHFGHNRQNMSLLAIVMRDIHNNNNLDLCIQHFVWFICNCIVLLQIETSNNRKSKAIIDLQLLPCYHEPNVTITIHRTYFK